MLAGIAAEVEDLALAAKGSTTDVAAGWLTTLHSQFCPRLIRPYPTI